MGSCLFALAKAKALAKFGLGEISSVLAGVCFVLGAGVAPDGSAESVIDVRPERISPDVSGVSTTPNAFSTGRLLRNLV